MLCNACNVMQLKVTLQDNKHGKHIASTQTALVFAHAAPLQNPNEATNAPCLQFSVGPKRNDLYTNLSNMHRNLNESPGRCHQTAAQW